MNMASKVKLGTPISKLMKDKSSPFDLDDNLGYFGFAGFLGFVVTNDVMICSSENRDRVPNHAEMFFTTIIMIRMSVWIQEPWGVNEQLNPKHGEAHCQICLP